VIDYRSESPHPYAPASAGRAVVWSETVASPGATFLRIHFTGFDLAPDDSVTVRDLWDVKSWTYTGRGPNGDGDFWSFAVEGDTAIVELHAGSQGGYGYHIAALGHGTVDLGGPKARPVPEVVCGTDGREDVACHLSEIDAAQKPVARLLFASGQFLYVCTGWLAQGSNNSTLVTNNHCIDTQAETSSLQATFGYQRTLCGTGTPNAGADYAGGTLLTTNKRLDFTLLTLQGNPEGTWGELIPTTKTVATGDLIWFIQHPGGNAKEVGYWEDAAHTVRCKVDRINQTYSGTVKRSQMAYGCDSEGGSSGSPIVDAASRHVIGLHHYGGVSGNPCLNAATEMPEICAAAGSRLTCATN
jgi:V8-like Glu-specific endopeptidase